MTSTASADAPGRVVARLAGGDAQVARGVVAELARHTPVLSSRSLSEQCGGRVLLKAENLQRTGSFKLRGALHKISRLADPRGVVAGSAGNHGQSLAYAAAPGRSRARCSCRPRPRWPRSRPSRPLAAW